MMKATAQTNSERCRPPSHARLCFDGTDSGRLGNPDWPPMSWASAIVASFKLARRDRVFRQDVANPLERFLGRRLRRHPFPDDVRRGNPPNLLGVRFSVSGIEDRIEGRCWLQHTLPSVG